MEFDYMIVLFLGILIVVSAVGGYVVAQMTTLPENKTYDGLRIPGNITHETALKIARQYDSGNWVCVNVIGMKYSRCVEVASHECGHELFAKLCETNSTACQKAQEMIG